MNRVCIMTLIGIPGSGKTTLTNFIKKKQRSHKYTVIHVSYDDLIAQQNASNVNEQTYNQARKNIVKCVEYIIRCFKVLPSLTLNNTQTAIVNKLCCKFDCPNDILIIIDDNSYYRSMRFEYFKVAQECEVSFLEVYLEVRLDLALLRNSMRESTDRVSEDIICKMNSKLQKPHKKNKWEYNFLHVDTENTSLEGIVKTIVDFTDVVIKKPEKTTETVVLVHQTILHKVDLSLRCEINNKMKDYSLNIKDKTRIAVVSEKLNRQRRQVLYEIRNGVLEMPTDDCTLEQFSRENIVL